MDSLIAARGRTAGVTVSLSIAAQNRYCCRSGAFFPPLSRHYSQTGYGRRLLRQTSGIAPRWIHSAPSDRRRVRACVRTRPTRPTRLCNGLCLGFQLTQTRIVMSSLASPRSAVRTTKSIPRQLGPDAVDRLPRAASFARSRIGRFSRIL